MSMKGYVMFNIATGLLKGAVLAVIVLWLLPLWEINIPIWGLILIVIAFLCYEIVTFRLGRRALELLNDMVERRIRYGKQQPKAEDAT